MNSSLKAALATVVCMAALSPVLALAQFKNEGYLTDKDGNVVKAVGNTVHTPVRMQTVLPTALTTLPSLSVR